MQSIAKTTMNHIFGRLVENGRIDLGRKVVGYIPEIGSGYAGANVQQVLDMDVMNNFNEGYDDSHSPAPGPGEPVGYGGQYLLADPDTEAAVVFFSVLESSHARDDSYGPEIIRMSEAVTGLP